MRGSADAAEADVILCQAWVQEQLKGAPAAVAVEEVPAVARGRACQDNGDLARQRASIRQER